MSAEFLEAALIEQSTIDVEEIMAALLQDAEQEGDLQQRLDDMKIRDYLYVVDRLDKEKDILKENKKKVVERWDDMIKRKDDDIERLRSVVFLEMQRRKEEDPKKGKLTLDIGTVSITTKKGVLVSADDFALQMKARETGDFTEHIIPASLNKTSLLKQINEVFKETEVVPEAYKDIVKLSEEKQSLMVRSKLKK